MFTELLGQAAQMWEWGGLPRDLGRPPGGSCCPDKSECVCDRNILALLLARPEELGVTGAFGSPGRSLPVLCRHRAGTSQDLECVHG